MKKAYLAISRSNRKHLSSELNIIEQVLHQQGIELFLFVDQYHFRPDQEALMMKTAFDEIRSSDLLIAEISKKAIGVGIEIGYAFALQKPILYLYKKGAPYSTTTGGCTNYIIEYSNPEHLREELLIILTTLD